MHNAKMNPTHFSGIVVDQPDGSCVKLTLNGKLFADFPFNGFLKCLQAECKKCVIVVVDVSTNANRPFRHQTLLARLLAANIMQDAFSISDHHIRNDLFEGRICFRLGTGHETVIFLFKDGRQIASNIRAKTLKNSKLLKERAWKHQNIFVSNSHMLDITGV